MLKTSIINLLSLMKKTCKTMEDKRMKNKLILRILTILLIFLFSNVSYVHAQNTTETSVIETYNKALKLFSYLHSIDRPIEDDKLAVDLIDYGVEIVKKAPRSFEAYTFVIKFQHTSFSGSLEYLDKVDKLKETYLKEIDNFENNLAEKFILMLAINNSSVMHDSFRWSWQDKELNREHTSISFNTLKKLSKYKDKDYAILATLRFLGLNDTETHDEIIAKFPDHPFIPLVKLSKTDSYFFNGNYDEAAEYAIKLSEEYKGIKMPEGYGFELECYEAACSAYLAKEDFNNAEKYLKLIEQAAPDSKIARAAREKYEYTKNPPPGVYKIDESSIKNFIEAQEKAKEKAKKNGEEINNKLLGE